MPATTARKGSAAYEAGIREGRAMSAKARRAPEADPEESEEPENEEEMDMDMGKKPHSRKRSAKNANNTKAPMDGGMYGKKPMDGECGCKGKKGGKCDGSCGGAMRKRADAALTPHEYLNACDLGIQDRSRSYIRARLDAAERLGLAGSVAGAAIGAASGGLQGAALGGGVQAVRKGGAAYGRGRERNKAVQGENKQAAEIDKIMKKRRDSPYASGFPLDSAALAI